MVVGIWVVMVPPTVPSMCYTRLNYASSIFHKNRFKIEFVYSIEFNRVFV